MTGFISRIITRHTDPQSNIVPRMPGKFESTAGTAPESFHTDYEVPGNGLFNYREEVEESRPNNHTLYNASRRPVGGSQNNGVGSTSEPGNGTVDPSDLDLKNRLNIEPATGIENDQFSILPGEDPPLYREKEINVSPVENVYSKVSLSHTSTNHQDSNEENQQAAAPTSFVDIKKEAGLLQTSQPLIARPSFRSDSKALLSSSGNNSQPDIKVHIGRIEIKAIHEPTSKEVPTKNSNSRKPAMSLDEYLKKRNER